MRAFDINYCEFSLPDCGVYADLEVMFLLFSASIKYHRVFCWDLHCIGRFPISRMLAACRMTFISSGFIISVAGMAMFTSPWLNSELGIRRGRAP